MMRTVEVFLVIIIILGAFTISSYYAVLPLPRRVSPINLRRWALTTLQMLDSNYNLSAIVFNPPDDPAWETLNAALTAMLPPSIVYNLTVYVVQSGSHGTIHIPYKSISNAKELGIYSEAASYLVTSSNVTFDVKPEVIGSTGLGGTLYILNCSDARGWWVTGYTAQSLAEDLYKLLSRYFKCTVLVNSTGQFSRILNNQTLTGSRNETVKNAVVINTFGEAIPIPSEYVDQYSSNYARYCHFLGTRVRAYNWTWVSIVGYPFFYVTNTDRLASSDNDYGIYGIVSIGAAGLNAFLQGLDGVSFQSDGTWIALSGVAYDVHLTPQFSYYCNRYGIYPSEIQTSSRALLASKLEAYHLKIEVQIFDNVTHDGKIYCSGALYKHVVGNKIEGFLLALGLTRTPDIRLSAVGILSYYKPRLNFHASYNGTQETRLVVLQLGQLGGV
jgi:hypothetical protein